MSAGLSNNQSGQSQHFIVYPAIDIESSNLSTSRSQSDGVIADINSLLSALGNAGLSKVHLVDLDLAFSRGENFKLMAEIISTSNLWFQISGGVRDIKIVERYLKLKAGRINLDPSWLSRPAELGQLLDLRAQYSNSCEFAIAVDIDADQVKSRGTGEVFGIWRELIPNIPEIITHVIVTDNNRDGKMSGIKLDFYREINELVKQEVIASGGVSSISDLIELKQLGLSGAIVGKAIYSGAITLRELADVIV